jgi:hypothetical protein
MLLLFSHPFSPSTLSPSESKQKKREEIPPFASFSLVEDSKSFFLS